MTYGSPDGQTYFIPGGYNTMVMYCNTAVFEEAGVELPETDWTWDEFSSGRRDQGVQRGVPPSDRVRLRLRQHHAVVAHERGEHDGADWTTATFNTPEAVAAAEFASG